MGDPIDLYCERTAHGLFGEPVNTLTNLLFLVAAAVLAAQLRRTPGARRDDGVLAVLVALVGTGSLIFHAVATKQTAVLDKLFIALFIWTFFHRYLARVAGLGGKQATFGVVLFILASAAVGRFVPPETLNGSVLYLPAVAGLTGIAAWTLRLHKPGAGIFIAALATFLVAILFRTIDLAVCDAWPLGTHFLWHSLNALVLYLCCRGLQTASDRNGLRPTNA